MASSTDVRVLVRPSEGVRPSAAEPTRARVTEEAGQVVSNGHVGAPAGNPAFQKSKTAETRLVAGMIEDARIQAFIRRALGADNPALAPPDLEFAGDYIRSMFVDAGVRDEYRFTFQLLKIDPDKVDWGQIAQTQIEQHFSSGADPDDRISSRRALPATGRIRPAGLPAHTSTPTTGSLRRRRI